jgi:PAS domain S-box-containing protein
MLAEIKRKKIENELKESNERFLKIFELNPIGLIISNNENGKFIMVNQIFCEIYGFTKEEVIGKTVVELNIIGQEIRDELALEFKSKREIKDMEILVRRKNGDQFWAEFSTQKLKLGDKELTLSAIQDISTRKISEKQLAEKASLLQATFDSSAGGILAVDNKRKIMTSNIQFQKMWKIPDEILATKEDNKALEFVLPQLKEPEMFMNEVNAVYSNPSEKSYYVIEFKDGRIFDRYSMPQKMNGKVVGTVWNFIDVTDQKISEKNLKQKSEELIHINSELEQVVYVASHDLREPLRTILNFSKLLESKYSQELDKGAKEYLNFIKSAGSKMEMLIIELLDFSRVGQNITFEVVDLNKILKEVLIDLDASINESNAIITIDKLPVLTGNEIKLKQLFQNLISNAIKFSKKNIKPEIDIHVKEKETEYLFSIKDNGIGIEEHNIGKLFVIFKRLNNANDYPGTGIGLATCKKIVLLHNGKIWIESELGVGSTFYFTIPKKI